MELTTPVCSIIKEEPNDSFTNEEQPYIVEKIVSKRTINGIVEYCLKWKFRNDTENTWVAAENIYDTDLVKIYEEAELEEYSLNHDDHDDNNM